MSGEKYESPLKFLQTAGAFVQAVHAPLNEPLNQLFEEMGGQLVADMFGKDRFVIARLPFE